MESTQMANILDFRPATIPPGYGRNNEIRIALSAIEAGAAALAKAIKLPEREDRVSDLQCAADDISDLHCVLIDAFSAICEAVDGDREAVRENLRSLIIAGFEEPLNERIEDLYTEAADQRSGWSDNR
jgi:hypothetical protein